MTKEQLNKIIADGFVEGSRSILVKGCWYVLIKESVANKLPNYIDLEDGTEVAVCYNHYLGKLICIPDKPGDKSNIVF